MAICQREDKRSGTGGKSDQTKEIKKQKQIKINTANRPSQGKMDDTQRIVKCGNLALHTPGGFFKKRWHSKYLVLYDGSKSGVKRLELFESEIKFKKQSPVKIIPLVDCVRIVTCQRHKTTFTFEVRTSDQFYLLASKSFQDMNDWVNCLRFVAFGQQQQQTQQTSATASVNPNSQLLAVAAVSQRQHLKQPPAAAATTTTMTATSSAASSSSLCATSSSSSSLSSSGSSSNSPASSSAASSASLAAASAALQKRNKDPSGTVDVLLQCQQKQQQQAQQQQNKSVSALSNGGLATASGPATPIMTASQAAAAAASALAKTRQRQPSLLGSCKPQPPTDSPFIQQQQQQQQQVAQSGSSLATPCGAGQIDTLTPTVRGQLIAAATGLVSQSSPSGLPNRHLAPTGSSSGGGNHLRRVPQVQPQATLDEEEENMLYCSIEDNPSEHNYRVKVIETELALRCQLKCYQLTASTTISQQYEELSQFRMSLSQQQQQQQVAANHRPSQMVTFYQLIIGPQELTLLNDYATSGYHQRPTKPQQPQGLWSWPYQCIRRYGFDKDNCFMFEAGRKCTSGPGQFVVQTPKAYNIYQDVVKFVNELRTISGSGAMPTNNSTAGGIAQQLALPSSQSADPAAAAAHATQSQTAAVTQIPVTWTPNCAVVRPPQNSITIPNEPNDNSSRRQFFDALRQLDCQQTISAATPQPVVAEATSRSTQENNQCSIINNNGGETKQPASIIHKEQPPVASNPPHLAIGASTQESRRDVTVQGAPPLLARSETARAIAVAQLESRLAGNKSPVSTARPMKQVAASQTGSCAKERQQQLAASISSGASAAAEEDETDESGYEQGDESVGSGKNTKKSLSNHSSDLSSSGSSSSSNSPGQSVSRRTGQDSGVSLNSRPTRLPLPESLTKPAAASAAAAAPPAAAQTISNSNRLPPSKLAQTLARVDHEDFEASLIRDVYSEITKLHAKFAVTTNGTDEGGSMSSGASHTTCSANSDDNIETTNGDEEEADYYSMDSEPMYTNLGAGSPPGRSGAPATAAPTITSSHHSYQFRAQQQHQFGNNYGDHPQHMYRPPHYPSILNPIPEIAEQQVTTSESGCGGGHTRTRQAPVLGVHNNNNNNNDNSNISTGNNKSHPIGVTYQQRSSGKPIAIDAEMTPNNTSDINKQSIKDSAGSPRARLALNRETIKKSQQSVGRPTAPQPLRGPARGSQSTKPTNHYLINDVQYAKISRHQRGGPTPMAATGGANRAPSYHQRR